MSENVEMGDESKSLEEIYAEKLAEVNEILETAGPEDLEKAEAAVAELNELGQKVDDAKTIAGLKERVAALETVEETEEEVVEEETKTGDEEEAPAEEVVDAEASVTEIEIEIESETSADVEVKEEETVSESQEETALSADKVINAAEQFDIALPGSTTIDGRYSGMEEFMEAAMAAYDKTRYGTDGEPIYIGRISDPAPEVMLEADKEASGRNLEKLTKFSQKISRDEAAMNASIGCCSSLDVIRDLTSYCAVDSSLFSKPRIAAPRGGLIWELPSEACGPELDTFEWEEVCGPDAKAQPDKPCQEIPCGVDKEEVKVQAFGWCFTYGNGFARFNREHLAYWLGEALCKFEYIAANRLLDLTLTHPRIVAAADSCESDCNFSAYANLVRIIGSKVKEIRDALCNQNLRLDLDIPASLVTALAFENAINPSASGTVQQIAAQFNLNLNVISHWQDQDTADCAFATNYDVLISAPGSIYEVDGGDLDFGLVRDSELNKQNKVKIQYERWNSVAFTGPDCSVKLLTITGLEFNGVDPARSSYVCA